MGRLAQWFAENQEPERVIKYNRATSAEEGEYRERERERVQREREYRERERERERESTESTTQGSESAFETELESVNRMKKGLRRGR